MDNHDANNDTWLELFSQIGGDDHQYYCIDRSKDNRKDNYETSIDFGTSNRKYKFIKCGI